MVCSKKELQEQNIGFIVESVLLVQEAYKSLIIYGKFMRF